tara:strand:+ start:11813 stop:12250 length:438 start_codon:yes stop_codon:yes gene_type:complete
MAITSTLTNSFKQELFKGIHNFDQGGSPDTFKLALYTNAATLNASTTAYSTSNEVTGTNYTAGGSALTLKTGTPTLDGTTAVVDFNNLTFTNVTVTARGALIYNSSDSNKAVAVIDFGENITATAGDLTITFPSSGASNSIIRVS